MRSMVRVMTDHPGSAQLAIATTVPTGPNALRVMEGMLAILRAALEEGAWADNAPDAAAVAERVHQIRDYSAALPPDSFPHIVALAGPLTQGGGEERFEFGLEVLVAGLERISDTN